MTSNDTVLLLLHPAATLSAVWAPVRRAWPRRWRILAPDLLPDGEPATQLARWAEQVAGQITQAGTGPAHVVGASVGASVALRLAIDYPALVASLTLDSAQLGGTPPPPALRHIGRLAGAATGLLPARLVAAALLTQFPAYRGPDRAAVRADILRLGVAGIVGHLRTQLAHDVRARVRDIAAPTLLFAGGRDPLTRAGAHLALCAAFPVRRVVIVPKAGHVTFLSQPEALAQTLPAWLSSLASQAA